MAHVSTATTASTSDVSIDTASTANAATITDVTDGENTRSTTITNIVTVLPEPRLWWENKSKVEGEVVVLMDTLAPEFPLLSPCLLVVYNEVKLYQEFLT